MKYELRATRSRQKKALASLRKGITGKHIENIFKHGTNMELNNWESNTIEQQDRITGPGVGKDHESQKLAPWIKPRQTNLVKSWG